MSSHKHEKATRGNIGDVSKAGITGTSGFVGAVTDATDPSVVRGLSVIEQGLQPSDRIKTEIELVLVSSARKAGAGAAEKF